MKNYNFKTGLLLFIGLSISAFTNNKVEKKEINTTKSVLEWHAAKISKSHHGTINLKSGHFLFENNKLIGGNFIVDMTTIVCIDLKDDLKNKFEKDLASDNFFGVDKYPESTYKITSISNLAPNKYQVNGNLTIKGITLENTFEILIEGNKAHGTISIDRTKYGIIVRSSNFFENLGLSLVYDNFDLKFSLFF